MSRTTSSVTLYRNAPMDRTMKNLADYNKISLSALLDSLSSITQNKNSYISIYKPIRWHTDSKITSDDLYDFNYLKIVNRDRTYYAFIDNVTYINDADSEIKFTIDIWTTYHKQFDLNSMNLIERAQIPQNLNNEDLRGAISINDPMLSSGTQENIIEAKRISYDSEKYGKNEKFLYVWYMPKWYKSLAPDGNSMNNSLKLIIFKVNPKSKSIRKSIANIMDNSYFYDGGKTNIVRAEIRENDSLDLAETTYNGKVIKSDKAINANKLFTKGDVILLDDPNFDENPDNDVDASSASVKNVGSGNTDTKVQPVHPLKNTKQGGSNVVAFYPKQKQIAERVIKIGTVTDLYHKLSEKTNIRNIKLLGAPYTSLRLTVYGQTNDYDIGSQNVSQTNDEIKVVRQQSTEPNSPQVYQVVGLNGVHETGNMYGVMTTGANDPFIVHINNEYPIPVSDSLAYLENFRDQYILNVANAYTNTSASNAINRLSYLNQKQKNWIMIKNAGIVYNTTNRDIIVSEATSIISALIGTSSLIDVLSDSLSNAFDAVKNQISYRVSKIKYDINKENNYDIYKNNEYNNDAVYRVTKAVLGNDFMREVTSDGRSLIGANATDWAIMAESYPYAQLVTQDISTLKANDAILNRYGNYILHYGKLSNYFGENSYHGHSYLKTRDANVKGSCPMPAVQQFNQMLDSGVTVWDNIKDFKERN